MERDQVGPSGAGFWARVCHLLAPCVVCISLAPSQLGGTAPQSFLLGPGGLSERQQSRSRPLLGSREVMWVQVMPPAWQRPASPVPVPGAHLFPAATVSAYSLSLGSGLTHTALASSPRELLRPVCNHIPSSLSIYYVPGTERSTWSGLSCLILSAAL